jgi:hypothetical protein
MNPMRGVFALGVIAGLCAFGTTGCYAEVETRPAVVTYSANATVQPAVVEEDVVYEESPVVEIESYPTVVYAGRPTYWVDGRWYYRGPRGWAYYRSEPSGLVTHRVEFERRYPEGFHVNAHVSAHVDAHAGGEAHAGGREHQNVHVNEHENVHENVHVNEHVNVHENVHVNEHVNVKAGAKASVKSNSKDHK